MRFLNKYQHLLLTLGYFIISLTLFLGILFPKSDEIGMLFFGCISMTLGMSNLFIFIKDSWNRE